MNNEEIECAAQELAVALGQQGAPEELVKLALLLAELAANLNAVDSPS